MENLSDILFAPDNTDDDSILNQSIEQTMSTFQAIAEELARITFSACIKEEVLISRVKKVFNDFILTIDIKTQLKLLSKYLSHVALRFQHLQDSIFQSLTILFGMCSSRPSYIYAAILGSSSTRIFSSVNN